MCCCSLFFFTAAHDHFHLGGRQHSSFSHCQYKNFILSHSQRNWSPFFLTLSLAFSLLSTSMKTLKFNRKKESSLLTLLFILSKDPSGHAEKRGRCLKCKISPWLTRGGWVTYGRTNRLYIKNDISALDQLQGLLFS